MHSCPPDTDYGTATCEGRPGTPLKYQEVDANTYAEWGVDSVKVDGCNQEHSTPLDNSEATTGLVFWCSSLHCTVLTADAMTGSEPGVSTVRQISEQDRPPNGVLLLVARLRK